MTRYGLVQTMSYLTGTYTEVAPTTPTPLAAAAAHPRLLTSLKSLLLTPIVVTSTLAINTYRNYRLFSHRYVSIVR